MKICFATNNSNKVKEINAAIDEKIKIISLKEIGCTEEIPEEQPTIAGNSLQKAQFVYNKYQINCFADDTGLEIEVLNSEPGVYSARYAGDDCNTENNMDLVLEKLAGKTNRKAKFKTVISLLINDEEHQFEGVVKGEIRTQRSGSHGFGYDPIFQPDGYAITFAEMSMEEKNKISHRGIAVRKLIDFLKMQNL